MTYNTARQAAPYICIWLKSHKQKDILHNQNIVIFDVSYVWNCLVSYFFMDYKLHILSIKSRNVG